MRVSYQTSALRLVEPGPFRRTFMRDGAAGSLTDKARIFSQRSRAVPWRPRLPGLATFRELVVVDQQIHAARTGIDPDAVSVPHQRQRATHKGFRRDVTDAHAARGA